MKKFFGIIGAFLFLMVSTDIINAQETNWRKTQGTAIKKSWGF